MKSLVAVLLALTALPAAAQTAYRLRDTPPWQLQESAVPFAFHTAVDRLFFFTYSPGGNGDTVLWATDGTAPGTLALRAICEGECIVAPEVLGNLGGTLLWQVMAPGDTPARLWRSDGTRAGTYPLTGPEQGVNFLTNDFPVLGGYAFFAGALWFTGCDDSGCDLWRTDGTAAGTGRYRDAPSTGGLSPTPAGNRLFWAEYNSQGPELWVTDGTPGGARLVRAMGIFGTPNLPQWMTGAGNRLFFVARGSGGGTAGGDQLWVSDGTEAGTRTLTQFPSDDAFGVPGSGLAAFGDHVYFAADDVTHGNEIWTSNGTPEGTRRATEFGYDEPLRSEAADWKEINGRLVFLATDGIDGPELWATSGTPQSTVALTDAGPCPDCPDIAPESFEPVSNGHRGIFIASTAAHGRELWSTDGTPAGTREIHDLCVGSCSTFPPFSSSEPELLPWPGGALFRASRPDFGPEIWFSDGSAPGTFRLTTVPGEPQTPLAAGRLGGGVFFGATDGQGGALWVSQGAAKTRLLTVLGRSEQATAPRELTAVGDRLFFSACAGETREVWTTRGTPESTAAAGNPAAAQPCAHLLENLFLAAGDRVFYWSLVPGTQLWVSDGTAAGTVQLLSTLDSLASPSLAFYKGKVYFAQYSDFGYGQVLWTTDGTPAGTGPFLDLPGDQRDFANLTVIGGALYFTAEDWDTRQTVLWITDGTAAGTRELARMQGIYRDLGNDDPGADFTVLGSTIYFRGGDGRLWKTDGSPGGTVRVAPAAADFFPRELTALDGVLYALSGNSLWRSNGTDPGTFLVRDLPVEDDYFSWSVTGLTAFAGRLYFAARDDVHGLEPWTSDGTGAGTRLLADLYPGAGSSRPAEFTAAGGRLYFVATDPDHGRELWRTDGTAEGTRLVEDLNPQAVSASPAELTVVGNRLYFVADDGLTGRELWALPLDQGTGCQLSGQRLCLGGGRFAVRADWRDFEGGTGAGQAVALSADTGYFWFFNPANVETVVKVLDGRGVNEHHWVFYGALSNVQYALTVTDTETGAVRRYFNPSGQFASVGDTRGFGRLGAASSEVVVAPPSPPARVRTATAAAAPCAPSATRLCLNNGRFAVEVAWKDFQGNTGTGKAVTLTADTGYFWFFNAANVEVVLKVLDGRELNDRFWVFYGALSNVEYTIRVTDTQTGAVRTYFNPAGQFASVGDTAAF